MNPPPNVLVIALPPMDHITFSHEAPDGTLRAWDVTRGNAIAADGRPTLPFRLADYDITLEWIQQNYQEIDLEYARTTDMTRPFLVIPFGRDECLIVDGWHRLTRAVMESVEELPMYLLTREEARSIQWLELPPGHGIG